MDGKRANRFADRQIAALAAKHHGVTSLAQLRSAGLTTEQVQFRLNRGRLHSVYRGVYAVGYAGLGFRGRWLAAVLGCGEGAVLSHRTAAALWGIRPSASPRIEVTVPSRNGRRPREGMMIHRVAELPDSEVTVCDGIPVTRVARTLLDLAAVVSRDGLKRAIKEADRLRLFDLKAVDQVLKRNVGRPGSRPLREVLERYQEPPFTRNELERSFLRLCARHGLPAPAVNAQLHGYEVDFLWRAGRLVVETDGRESHGTRAAFEDDRKRDAHLTVLGYRVVRFTHRQVLREPDFVAGVLRELLQPDRSMSSTR
jgi:very-short-patch-repair endonuclease